MGTRQVHTASLFSHVMSAVHVRTRVVCRYMMLNMMAHAAMLTVEVMFPWPWLDERILTYTIFQVSHAGFTC